MKLAHTVLDAVGNTLDAPTSLEVANKLIYFHNGDNEITESVRHFGLQLVENSIKFKWAEMNLECQDQVKAALQTMITDDSFGRDSKLAREGLSKCVVEAMKKVWPLQWENLLPLMLALPWNEKVLLVLGRLSEELGIFYSPENRDRRRDMNAELKYNYDNILKYIGACLDVNQIELCSSALRTLDPFLECFPWNSVSNMAELFTFLCRLMAMDYTDPNLIRPRIYLKRLVCDCLITCLFRKGPKKERSTLLCLFYAGNLNNILDSIDSTYPLLCNTSFVNDSFELLKRLCAVVGMMGQTAISLFQQEAIEESLWRHYVHKMHSYLAWDNYILNAFILQFWRDLASSKEVISNVLDDNLINMLLNVLPGKLVKKPYEEVTRFLGYDFDDKEDYEAFFCKFKAECVDLIRSLTTHRNDLCFSYASNLLLKLINSELGTRNDWEVVAVILDAVCNKLVNLEAVSSQGIHLLNMIIQKCNKFDDLAIVSSQLSCISALSIFLSFAIKTAPNILDILLQKIFFLAAFERPGGSKQNRAKDVRDIRRHASAFFIKLTRSQTSILFPLFPQLHDLINKLHIESSEFTQTEMYIMKEGLLILSNSIQDINVQREFIKQLVQPITWFTECLMNTETLITFLGLNVLEDNDQKAVNHARLSLVTTALLALLNRVTRKDAVSSVLIPFLAPISLLISSLNSLWRPDYQKLCHSDLRPIIFTNISDTDRSILLGPHSLSSSENGADNVPSKSNALRMQTFLQTLHENCYTIVGGMCSLLKPEFFIEFKYSDMVLTDISLLPDMKLRMIARSLIKPFIYNFPKEDLNFIKTNFIPLIDPFLAVIFKRIDDRCETFRVGQPTTQEIEEKLELESEILQEKVNRLLSIEFLEILNGLLLKQNRNSQPRRITKPGGNAMENDWEMGEGADKSNHSHNSSDESFSEIGDYLMKNVASASFMTSMCFKCLTWLESDISCKAASLCHTLLERLITNGLIRSDNDVWIFLISLIKALNYFGEYEVNEAAYLNIILLLYETVVIPLSLDSIRQKLAETCECDLSKWLDFESNFLKKPPNQPPEKPTASKSRAKREAIRRLLDPVIGKSVSCLGKRAVKYEGPRFLALKRSNNKSDIFSDDTLNLCQLFISKC